jgi:hypothetical protein
LRRYWNLSNFFLPLTIPSQELERRVEVAGYLFTKATLKTNLMDLSPLTTGQSILESVVDFFSIEREIDLFVNELQYPGGTVSSMDVISYGLTPSVS